jgi:hypothetical protein
VDEESRLAVVTVESAPSVSAAERLAAQVVGALDVIAAHLNLETPHPKTAGRVRGSRTVSPEFMSSMIASAEALAQLRVFGFDPEKARLALQSKEAFRIIAERLAMLLASVNYTMESRWAEVVADALTAYALASRQAGKPKNPELAAHVANLRRHLGRTNRAGKSKKKA